LQEQLGHCQNYKQLFRHLACKVDNIFVIPSLSYGCEIWTLKQSHITTAEMKFMSRTAEYNSAEHRRNEDI